MAITRILAIDDDPAVREMLHFILEQDGYHANCVGDASRIFKIIKKNRPDLILLDWILPGTSGIELAKKLKKKSEINFIPIIMLTAKADEDDIVNGLNAGADDYVIKPFSPRELLARIRSLLRRVSPIHARQILECDGLVLDPISHRVVAQDHTVDLGPTEYRLLHYFMTHQDRVYSRSQLLDRVWGSNVFIEERTVDVHVRRLRKSLQPVCKDGMLQTVRGAGYRFSIDS